MIGRGAVLWLACATPEAMPSSRIITGGVVPYGVLGVPHGSGGTPVRFLRGSIDLHALADSRLLLDHDATRPVGRPTGLIDAPAALSAAWAIAATRDGDEALELVRTGVRDGLSIAGTVDEWTRDYADDGAEILTVTAFTPRETSLVTFPAYRPARATPNP